MKTLNYILLIALLMVAIVSSPIGLTTANDCHCADKCACIEEVQGCCGGCDESEHEHDQSDNCKCNFAHVTNSAIATIVPAICGNDSDVVDYHIYLPNNRIAAAYLFDTPRPPLC